MTAICRVNTQIINRHERRRGDHRNLPRLDPDILRSMSYWRRYRNTGPHAAEQYRQHRAIAMKPVRLSRADFLAGCESVRASAQQARDMLAQARAS